MNALIPVLLVLAALAVGLLPVFFLVSWVWWQRRRDARRSPITDELMHLPGEQAQREADRLMDVADERMLIVVLIGPMILAVWALEKVDARSFHFGITEAVLLILVLIVGVWATWSASKVLRARRKYLEGRAAERATAQAMASLMSKGCVVYHDIPAGKFNLDHVVVGPGAVFMVETKSRRNDLPPTGRTNR